MSETNRNTKRNSAWVLCPSKRYPGKFYYFNVRTGESAWNLYGRHNNTRHIMEPEPKLPIPNIQERLSTDLAILRRELESEETKKEFPESKQIKKEFPESKKIHVLQDLDSTDLRLHLLTQRIKRTFKQHNIVLVERIPDALHMPPVTQHVAVAPSSTGDPSPAPDYSNKECQNDLRTP